MKIKEMIKNRILSKNFILPFKSDCRFIFIYHDISDASSAQHSFLYSTPKSRFEEQLAFLSEHFDFVNLDEISRKEPFKKNVVSIVFDDGFKSVQTDALPVLKKRNIPFAVFVNRCAIQYNRLWVSDLVLNKDRFIKDYELQDLPAEHIHYKLFEKDVTFNNKLFHLNLEKDILHQTYLNEADILSLKENGAIIGNHGTFHANLASCNAETLEKEIVENKQFIEHIIHSEVKHYAYAFGKKEHYSEKAIEIIKKSGHVYAYTSNPVAFKKDVDQQRIPRFGVTNQSPAELMFYINRQFLKAIHL